MILILEVKFCPRFDQTSDFRQISRIGGEMERIDSG